MLRRVIFIALLISLVLSLKLESYPQRASSVGPGRFRELNQIYASCLKESLERVQESFHNDLDADPKTREQRFEEIDRSSNDDGVEPAPRVKAMIALSEQVEACGAKLERFPPRLRMEWMLHKKLENSLVITFADDVFTDASGHFVDDEKPLKRGTLEHLQKGLGQASQLLKYWHNYFARDIQKRFPNAKLISTAFETRLCNSPYGYHEFVCSPPGDCPLTAQTGVITSSRTYKGVVRGMLFGYKEYFGEVTRKRAASRNDLFVSVRQLKTMLERDEGIFRITSNDMDDEGNIPYELNSKIKSDPALMDAITLALRSADLMPYYNNLVLFMLAHEQGHIVLQQQLQCSSNEVINNEKNKTLELEADAYGAYLLGRIYARFSRTAEVENNEKIIPPKFDEAFLKTSYTYAGFEDASNYPSVEQRLKITRQSMDDAMSDAISRHRRQSEDMNDDDSLDTTLYAYDYLIRDKLLGYFVKQDIYHFRLGFLLPERKDYATPKE